MHKLGRAMCAAGIALSVAFTGACGSDSDASAPAEPVVDLASLDVGGFPTQIKPYDKVTSIELAKLIEGERLANYLPLPSEIMPEVKYAPSAMGGAIRPFIDFNSAAIKSRADADPNAMNEAAKGFVAGFVTTGRSDALGNLAYELDNVVMLFSDEKAAADAGAALGRLDLESSPNNEAVQIPDHPDAIAFASNDSVVGAGMLRSWYSTGKFVVFTYVYDSVMSTLKERNLPKLLERAKRSIEVVTPRVAKFPATPSDQLMELKTDPDGVLARALFTSLDDNSQRGMPGVYDRQGGLQISGAPEVDGPLFDKTGVDRVAWRGSFLYRTQDAASAAEFVTARTETSRKFARADSPKNLPNAQCRKLVSASKYEIAYYCFVSHGRFAAEVAANQLLDAQQRISAQYALLVNSN